MVEIDEKLDIHIKIENIAISVLKIAYHCINKPYPKHSHSSNSYEIHYVPEGIGTLFTNKQSYPLSANSLFITGPHIEHEQIPDQTNPMYEYSIYLKINPEGLTKDSILDTFCHYPFWIGYDHEALVTLFEQLIIELQNKRIGYTTLIQSLLSELIVKLVRNYESTALSRTTFSKGNPYEQSFLLIEDSFLYDFKSLTIKELAKRLGLSERQTSRIIYSYYGLTFLQKRTESRMAAAITLLRNSNRPVYEIAEELGYSCGNHFCTAFKQYYGKTIKEYLKSSNIKRVP
jgi:AraC-like DNA-binding protein